jgi:hypothetical protein
MSHLFYYTNNPRHVKATTSATDLFSFIINKTLKQLTDYLAIVSNVVRKHLLIWGLLLTIYFHFLKYIPKRSRARFAGANKNSYGKFLIIEITLRDHTNIQETRNRCESSHIIESENRLTKEGPKSINVYKQCLPRK